VLKERESTAIPPLVSVIVPCYNRSTIVGRAIASALGQTYPNLELLVIDDGSIDGKELAKVVSDFGDPRIRLLRHRMNRNGAAARNTGVSESRGDFVAFLDSDDEWMPEKIERQLTLLNYDPRPCRLAYSVSEVITDGRGKEKRTLMPLRPIGRAELVSDYLFLNRGYLQTSAMLLPRWLALEVLFNEMLKRHQDYDLLLRLEGQSCQFVMHPDPLVRVHWEGFHQVQRGLNPENSLFFLREYRCYLSTRSRSAFALQQIVLQLLRAKRRLEAMKVLALHVRLWHLKPVDYVNLASHLFSGDDRIAVNLAKLRQQLLAQR
jgi:glycosyltransferase involved in cell wall biosynthesis